MLLRIPGFPATHYGLNPLYHNPETGHLLSIPSYYLMGFASQVLFGILLLLVGITVWMLEDELSGGRVPPSQLVYVS